MPAKEIGDSLLFRIGKLSRIRTFQSFPASDNGWKGLIGGVDEYLIEPDVD
jgi:hypothetical protein